jgi:hypothetical protein
MTVESSPKLEPRFVQDSLPWVVGAAALAIYLATLNHWVTLNSLTLVARVNGWTWQPILSQPLLWLLTFPFRGLPAGWVPLALNVSSAVCASLTLATLARSVALLRMTGWKHNGSWSRMNTPCSLCLMGGCRSPWPPSRWGCN